LAFFQQRTSWKIGTATASNGFHASAFENSAICQYNQQIGAAEKLILADPLFILSCANSQSSNLKQVNNNMDLKSKSRKKTRPPHNNIQTIYEVERLWDCVFHFNVTF